MTAIGRTAGPVRSPLVDLNEQELSDLKKLIGDRS
jgi:5-dehydro-4-deoxyglucarate dehydratase